MKVSFKVILSHEVTESAGEQNHNVKKCSIALQHVMHFVDLIIKYK